MLYNLTVGLHIVSACCSLSTLSLSPHPTHSVSMLFFINTQLVTTPLNTRRRSFKSPPKLVTP